MFVADLIEKDVEKKISVLEFHKGNMRYFNFNGKKYHKDQVKPLLTLLSERLMEDQDLSVEHYRFKVKKYLLNLRFEIFILRCHREGILEKAKWINPY